MPLLRPAHAALGLLAGLLAPLVSVRALGPLLNQLLLQLPVRVLLVPFLPAGDVAASIGRLLLTPLLAVAVARPAVHQLLPAPRVREPLLPPRLAIVILAPLLAPRVASLVAARLLAGRPAPAAPAFVPPLRVLATCAVVVDASLLAVAATVRVCGPPFLVLLAALVYDRAPLALHGRVLRLEHKRLAVGRLHHPVHRLRRHREPLRAGRWHLPRQVHHVGRWWVLNFQRQQRKSLLRRQKHCGRP
mmetsp:Transcript_9704/g.16852  ORF Transcript_9704/g.16852 Transcript_9704/m.16852 type:complete len:246 (+) Transcript_9704:1442-2179(+)